MICCIDLRIYYTDCTNCRIAHTLPIQLTVLQQIVNLLPSLLFILLLLLLVTVSLLLKPIIRPVVGILFVLIKTVAAGKDNTTEVTAEIKIY